MPDHRVVDISDYYFNRAVAQYGRGAAQEVIRLAQEVFEGVWIGLNFNLHRQHGYGKGDVKMKIEHELEHAMRLECNMRVRT